jgi:DNA-binding PadR family transcriptional regulator
MSPRPIGLGTARILQAIRAGHRYGADIVTSTGQGAGTVYKVLRRIEEMGFVVAKWEDAAIAERERRPRRRYYRITPQGQKELTRAVERYHALEPSLLRRTVPERSR